MDNPINFWLDIIAQFSGGRGEAGNNLVPFGLAAALWGALLVLAWFKNRRAVAPRERLLIWGFGLGFAREVLMLVGNLLHMGEVDHQSVHLFFPPLKHAFSLAAETVVAVAFVQYLLNAAALGRRLLLGGLALVGACFATTFLWWGRVAVALPDLRFAKTWCDWSFHLVGCAVLMVAFFYLVRSRGWVRNMVLLALGFFFLEDFLKIFDLATGMVSHSTLMPVRNSLHLLAIPLLGYVYVKEMVLERELLSTTVEQAVEGIIIIGPERKIEYANAAVERLTGFSREEIVGQGVGFLRSGKQNEISCEDIWDTLRRGEPWRGRVINRRKDGGSFEGERTIFPVRNPKGEIVNYVALIRDMSNEMRMERQLGRAQRLEAIGTLAGGIAHDFNNILSPIMGYTELTLESLPPDSPAREHLNQVLAATGRARDLVKQILASSRSSSQPRQPVQIAPIVKETLKLLRASLPTTIDIEQRLEAGRDVVLADPTQIHQVMLNLATNGAQAMGTREGTLRVGLSEERVAAGAARHHDLEEGAYLRLTVSDTGCGMTAEVEERIFEPFFTTKDVDQGTGLGLTVVQGIVKSHGGAILIDSEPGRGTTFEVYFPQLFGEAVAAAEEKASAFAGGEHILFVDDERSIADLGNQGLKRLGYRVSATTSGPEALELFRERPDDFDLVITDQTMPQMTGTVLAGHLVGIRPDIPIILCTGYSPGLTPEAVAALGIREMVNKPLTAREYGEAIRRVLVGASA
ncbi:MAG: hypothetical protein C0617_06395 [Desulfuromonas sp.]|uniref:hybrid sensor histidine kinase/response regulator n=1 Tax=Desulfuromonas sp. TaxID=892 RepID=UPI000CC95414|nr:ATP-binding protein [Desulfuromonas sp.]PLX84837.1 MAG: hypothetical protein C0617_06395 [Desulfuromonas sp.]